MKVKRFACMLVTALMTALLCVGAAFAEQGDTAGSGGLASGEANDDGGLGDETTSKDIVNATITLPKSKYVYTGSAIQPKPQVVLDGITLECGGDYSVAYGKNTAVGIGTVTVTGLESAGFNGTARATFKIFPKQATLASAKSASGAKLTAKAAKVPGAKGYQYRIGTNKALTKNVRKATVTKRSHTFKNLKQGAKYYAKVRAYGIIDGKAAWGKWSAAKAVTVKWKPVWKQSGGYFTYLKSNGKLARGLTEIGGKTYLFDSQGRQKLGWQRVKGTYRFFTIANKSRGYMVTNAVVNGIKLDKKGAAQVTGAAGEELVVMRKAQALAESLTVPTQSKNDKLWRGFNHLKYNCTERLTRNFSNYNGWHRAMALDVFDRQMGSCFNYGAALAYYANAIGYGQCAVISSGGHGWAEIDGKVYDAEWSRHCGRDLFAINYGTSGAGVPAYASARIYVVQIAPNGGRW